MEWIRGPILGRGSTATVSLAASTTSHELFAVKSAELSRSDSLQKEQFLMSRLGNDCPSIVTYMGYDVTRENGTFFYNLWMEYVPGGTLHEAIKRHGGRLDESVIKSYTRQILQGLDHLHANGIVHCDVKSQNILLGNDGPKIADLGCAKKLKIETRDGNSNCSAPSEERFSGTPMFMSPEVARGKEQGFAADVWAVGCMVLEMASGNTPWPEAEDPVSVLYRIGFSEDVPEFPDWLCEDAKDFLRKCLRRDPKERWLVKELLRHPFVNEMGTKEIGFHMDSPSDVLDNAFWESMDVCESPRNLDSSDCSCSCSSSVDGRIEQLIGSNSMPNWAGDEDWVTIRSNEEDGRTEIFWQDEEIFAENDLEVADQSVIVSSVMYFEEYENPVFDVFNEISIDDVDAPGYIRGEQILSAGLDGVNDDIEIKSLNFEEEIEGYIFLSHF